MKFVEYLRRVVGLYYEHQTVPTGYMEEPKREPDREHQDAQVRLKQLLAQIDAIKRDKS